MNIWLFNHYAGTPETTAATRPYELSKALIKKGHKVTIFASSFSEYTCTEQKLSKNENWKIEQYDGIIFVWIKTFPYQKNNWRRIINMVSYTWRVYWLSVKLKEKPDVIIGTCVHPLAVLDAYLVSRIKHCRFINEITDLWPQTLIDMGKLSGKNPIAWKMRILERFLFHKADKIITLMPRADIYITKLGISRDKIFWIPQVIDLSNYSSLQNYSGGTPNKFTIMYLGRHGIANALNTILKAAKLLQDVNHSEIHFVFVGEGPEKKHLIDLSGNLKLNNVEFRGHVPKSQVSAVMNEADTFILSMQKIDLYQYGISSNKLCDYLASGRPTILAGKSVNDPVFEANAGISIAPEDPRAMAKAILDLKTMSPESRIQMGKNGISYVKLNHDINTLANKLEKILQG